MMMVGIDDSRLQMDSQPQLVDVIRGTVLHLLDELGELP